MAAFDDVKLNQNVFVVYEIDSSTSATVPNDLVAVLADNESRYAFYNLVYQTSEGSISPSLSSLPRRRMEQA